MSSDDFSSVAQPFAVDVRHVEGRAVVALSGELDLATAPELRERLGILSEKGENQVTLDLTHLDFVDSTGLSVFVMALNRAQAGGGPGAGRCASAIRRRRSCASSRSPG